MIEGFNPTNQLERLLADALTDPAARPAFYRALSESELYVVDHGQPHRGVGWVNLTDDTRLQFRMLEVGNKLCIPVFTSVERIELVIKEKVQYLAMNALALLQMFQGKDLVLNPGSKGSRIMPKEEVSAILDGSIFALPEPVHRGGRKMILGVPAEHPHELADVLARYFASVPQVKAAYLALATWPDSEDPPSILIGIQIESDPKQALEGAGMVLSELKPSLAVDMLTITERSPGFPGNYLLKHIKPFYRRKLFGIF